MIPQLVVGWVLCLAPCIPNCGHNNPSSTPKNGLCIPKSAKPKGGSLKLTRRCLHPPDHLAEVRNLSRPVYNLTQDVHLLFSLNSCE